MEEFTLSQVKNLFQKFSEKPLARILTKFSQENPDSLSLEEIHEKLNKNLYASPFDFTIDMRDLLLQAQKFFSDNKNAYLVIEDLTQYFETQIGSLPLTKKEEVRQRLQACLSKYTKVRRAMALSAFTPGQQKAAPQKTSVSKSIHGPPAPLIQEIQRKLNEVTDVETLAEVCRILKMHIPNFELQETMTIDTKNLSTKCIEDLRRALSRTKAPVE